ERDDAQEKALAVPLGGGEQRFHPRRLRRVVGGQIAQQDVGVEPPHPAPRRILASSSARRLATSRSRSASDGAGRPGVGISPRSSRKDATTGCTCTVPSLAITKSRRSPSPRWKWSRTSFGSVSCPLLVRVVMDMFLSSGKE